VCRIPLGADRYFDKHHRLDRTEQGPRLAQAVLRAAYPASVLREPSGLLSLPPSRLSKTHAYTIYPHSLPPHAPSVGKDLLPQAPDGGGTLLPMAQYHCSWRDFGAATEQLMVFLMMLMMWTDALSLFLPSPHTLC
jgi:hypothetical protein